MVVTMNKHWQNTSFFLRFDVFAWVLLNLVVDLLKAHWTTITSSPNFFQKSWDFYIFRSFLMVMTACWVLHSRLIYFWRNVDISSIFYFSKSTSINTQYSSLWDTLKMMLFTKYLIKWKGIDRIGWKFRYWFNLKLSVELDKKGRCCTCSIPL